ncbi:MAG: hypothetical protein HRT68_13250 [Flavobacteriaceae bacterium]|nr:hypothetical protein [Flavobacteriaceae bacterium]
MKVSITKQNSLIRRFNNLDGRNVRRATLFKLSREAKGINDTIFKKIDDILSKDNRKEFPIKLKKKLKLKSKPKVKAKKSQATKTRASADKRKSNGLGLPLPTVDELEDNVNPSYNIGGDIGKLLGDPEIKPRHSLAINIDSDKGAGKTHFIYQVMNAFADSGYKVLLNTLEEHATSNLVRLKRDKYFNSKTKQYISIVSEDRFEEFSKYFNDYDVIFIDSWNDLVEENKGLSFDKDLRKKYDGKLFINIFQRTSGKSVRGGTSTEFKGDIILKVEKHDRDFTKNYVWQDKNRYNENTSLIYYIADQRIADFPGETSTKKSNSNKSMGKVVINL